MKRILQFVCLLAVIPTLSQLAAGQTGASRVYREQFFDLRSKVQSVLKRTEPDTRGPWTSKIRTDLRQEILALTKLVHRLEEEAMTSDLSNDRSDKTILLVSAGCKALDFVLGAVDSFVETDDRSFLGLARERETLIKSVERLL